VLAGWGISFANRTTGRNLPHVDFVNIFDSVNTVKQTQELLEDLQVQDHVFDCIEKFTRLDAA
jgi:hypothetical protein